MLVLTERPGIGWLRGVYYLNWFSYTYDSLVLYKQHSIFIVPP